ncbi:hypothetical protein B484DRAFT_422643 [Ochromonadaceae sp. CCMP2298]|nr:hypothetical protein B484DRAFT_422643 [Ochromonadaceae sp. CCMP2298]
MGNAAFGNMPSDLTKCSFDQLQVMINSVIVNNPWNEESEDEQQSLEDTVAEMRARGFRAITPGEYLIELRRKKVQPSVGKKGVRVWISIDEKCVYQSNRDGPVDRREGREGGEGGGRGGERHGMGREEGKQAFEWDRADSKDGDGRDGYGYGTGISISIPSASTLSPGHSASVGMWEEGGEEGWGVTRCLPVSGEDAARQLTLSGCSAACLSEITDAEHLEDEEGEGEGDCRLYSVGEEREGRRDRKGGDCGAKSTGTGTGTGRGGMGVATSELETEEWATHEGQVQRSLDMGR